MITIIMTPDDQNPISQPLIMVKITILITIIILSMVNNRFQTPDYQNYQLLGPPMRLASATGGGGSDSSA